MDNKSFIKNAIKTESIVEEIRVDKSLLLNAVGAYIEAAEILDIMKKVSFYNNQQKMNNLPKLISNLKDKVRDIERDYERIKLDSYIPEYASSDDINTRIVHGILGICTEGGELAEILADMLIKDTDDIDRANLIEELFDGDWYKAIISDEMDIDWEESWDKIINKLKARFGDKFSEERANNRDLEAERKILDP